MSALARRLPALVAALVLSAQVLLGAQPVLAAGETPHFYAVLVNGQSVSPGALILERPDGALLAAEDDLAAWGFELKGHVPALVYQQTPYYALRDFTDLKTNLVASTQTLELQAPPALFVPTKIRLPGQLGGQPVFARGAYLNYDLDAQRAGPGTSTSNLFALGYTGLPGGAVVTNRFAEFGQAGGRPTWSRIATTFQRDNLQGLGTLRVGDAVSSGGTLGAPAAFAGIQRATDFDIDPSLVVFPTLSAGGVSQTQSTVDVYVNDVQQARRGVPAGPFTISNLPTLDGQGNVTLVVRDIYGRERTIVTPFYFTRALLRAGLAQSSVEAGVLRRDFGTGWGSYGGGMVSGTLRRGLSNSFTGEVHAEGSGDVRLVELGGDAVAARLGVFHFAAAQSWTPGASGLRGLLGYEFSSGLRGAAAFANVDAQSARFASLGRPALGESVTATLGLHKVLRGSRQLSLAAVSRNQAGLPATTAVSAGFDTPIGAGTWHFALTKALASGATGGSVQFSLFPGLRRSVDGQANFGSAGSLARIAAHQSAPPDGFGTGYDLGLGRNPSAEIDADVFSRSPAGSANLALVHSAGGAGTSYDLRLLGGLALVDGHLSPTDQVSSSYGLVEVPGFPNVRVYNGARLVGRTDARGRVFISDLVPYEPNEITLDARDLPLTVDFDSITARVTPYARNAAVIRFRGRPAGGVLIETVDAGGAPLPVGTALAAPGADGAWTVARGGVAYLRGVRPGPLPVTATAGALTCRFTVQVPANAADIPDLGPQVCMPAPPAASEAALAP